MNSIRACRPSFTAPVAPSSVAATYCAERGLVDVSDVLGGYGAWAEAVQNT